MLDYRNSLSYKNLSRLIQLYIESGDTKRYLTLVDSLVSLKRLNKQKLELIYALLNTSQYLKDSSMVSEILVTFCYQLLEKLATGRVTNYESLGNQYFQLTYHLVNTIITKASFTDNEYQDKLFSALSNVRESIFDSATDEDHKLGLYFVVFGYIYAFAHNTSFLVSNVSKDPESIKTLTFLNSMLVDATFFNQLESIIANSLVISLNDSIPNLNGNANGSAAASPSIIQNSNYKLLHDFNSEFEFVTKGISGTATEFCSLLFVKYLSLIKLNVVLNLSKLRVSTSKNSVVEKLVSLKAKELKEAQSKNIQDLKNGQFNDEANGSLLDPSKVSGYPSKQPVLKTDISDNFGAQSIFSNTSYFDSDGFTDAEKDLLVEFAVQSKDQLRFYQNGAPFIILSSLARVNLLFQCKALNIEIYSCLLFFKIVKYSYVYHEILSKNLVLLYTSNSTSSMAIENHEKTLLKHESIGTINSQVSGHNLEMRNEYLSFNIIGLLSLMIMDESASKSEISNITNLINKEITKLTTRLDFGTTGTPPVNFEKVLKKSLHCIAISYSCCAQDAMVGLIYSLSNTMTETMGLFSNGYLLPLGKDNVSYTASSKHEFSEISTLKRMDTSKLPKISKSLNNIKIMAGGSTGENVSIEADKAKADLISSSLEGYENCLMSIVELVNVYQQSNVTVMSLSMLGQKVRLAKFANEPQEKLNGILIRNLYKIGYSLINDQKTFQMLIKSYFDYLNTYLANDLYDMANLVIDALSDLASFLKQNFYISSATASATSSIAEASNDTSAREISGSVPLKGFDLNSPYVNPNYKILLHDLLKEIASKGDTHIHASHKSGSASHDGHHRSHIEISEVAQKIEVFFKPLASILPDPAVTSNGLLFSNSVLVDEVTVNLFRDMWFNLVVHGVNIDLLTQIIPGLMEKSVEMPKRSKVINHKQGVNSEYSLEIISYLKIIAFNSPPLASKLSWSHNENLLELNTVLRRGSSNSNVRFQKSVLEYLAKTSKVPSLNLDIDRDYSIVAGAEDSSKFTSIRNKITSTPKLMFLAASVFLEFLRIESGDFYKILLYFFDPSVKLSSLEKDMRVITFAGLRKYLTKISELNSNDKFFSIGHISQQLHQMLTLVCATNNVLQETAVQCCDILIAAHPNVFSYQESFTLFKLLDLLSLLFGSIVNYEKQKYNPVLEYSLPNYSINSVTKSHDIVSFEKINLLDSLEWRQTTFEKLRTKAKEWIILGLKNSGSVLKNLLQTYMVINTNVPSKDANYTSIRHYKSDGSVNFGVSFAIEMGRLVLPTDKEVYNVTNIQSADTLVDLLATYNLSVNSFSVANRGDVKDFMGKVEEARHRIHNLYTVLHHYGSPARSFANSKNYNEIIEIVDLVSNILSLSKNSNEYSHIRTEFLKILVEIPFKVFNCDIFKYTISHWLIISANSNNLQFLLISEILQHFKTTIIEGKGLFDNGYKGSAMLPEFSAMEYAPSNKKETNHFASVVSESFKIHTLLIRLISSFFHSNLNQASTLLRDFNDFICFTLKNFNKISAHPFSRMLRSELIKLSIDVLIFNLTNSNPSVKSRSVVLSHSSHNTGIKNFVYSFVSLILDAALDWFKYRKTYPFGDNLLKIKTDFGLLVEIAQSIPKLDFSGSDILITKKTLLLMFMDNEINSIYTWLNCLMDNSDKTLSEKLKNFELHSSSTSGVNANFVKKVCQIEPIYIIQLLSRLNLSDAYTDILKEHIHKHSEELYSFSDAVKFLVEKSGNSNNSIKKLPFWDPISPIESINLFLPKYDYNSYTLQYAMKSLTMHDINVVFFYVPQLTQMLRFDDKSYVQKFILETAQISQLFAHQIIWNMLANRYKDDEGTIEDSIKPILDETRDMMLKSFAPEDLSYYEKEFEFFAQITGISGKLKPYIKKTKAEKKLKIDEEMSKIVVEKGVYLPSNPDGVLVDINRTSGKPLQSHAKAPFMASFRISREVPLFEEDENEEEEGEEEEENSAEKVPEIYQVITGEHSKPAETKHKKIVETWQSAIFKVGDDCRQDLLALQLISVFRSIWSSLNLDLYVFPYRVIATEAGCGIIDVLPNSVSRDMLGREAVNGLYQYYTTKFGPEYSTEFQVARNNLVKSLAAYSIISYLLQFKDRHNGNIMYDDEGHILHIDFGFCFDIVPGGVKFEAVPFKLTKEMVMVMGGSNQTQYFNRFEELCVQGFLAVRPYMDVIVDCVLPMLESGLPCFKGMTTIKNLKNRFVPEKTEKEAAVYMRKLIKKSYESFFTKGYDEFQRITNGIPY